MRFYRQFTEHEPESIGGVADRGFVAEWPQLARIERLGMRRALRSYLVGVCVLGLCAWATAQQASPAKPQTVAETLGYAADARLLVIQAEDLGMAHSIDKASFEALEKGWVTTAGILVPGPWFPEVLRWSRNHPNADLGIRLDLNSDWSSYRWRPISGLQKGSGLTDPGGYLSSSQTYVAQAGGPVIPVTGTVPRSSQFFRDERAVSLCAS